MRAACFRPIAALAVSLVLGACGGETLRLGDSNSGLDAGSGGSAGTPSCAHGGVLANEVLWIGDSWVNIPGTQHTRVRDLARAAGAIGPNDDYVDLAASASTIAMVATQYDTAEAGSTKVKVLIMDGGTWDTILTGGAATSVTSAVNRFTQLLAHIASDGTVEHVVYYLCPELPTIPGVAALRPGLQQACATSAVPCHFIDLQPLWANHPEYTAADGIQASPAGANVIADAIWATMQDNCVEQ